ncbi:MAG: hypothetical protein AAF297_07245 [Planctomycetota bacterium]
MRNAAARDGPQVGVELIEDVGQFALAVGEARADAIQGGVEIGEGLVDEVGVGPVPLGRGEQFGLIDVEADDGRARFDRAGGGANERCVVLRSEVSFEPDDVCDGDGFGVG